jgi:NAD(P)-dependent dehydrogenase (short-subunit alcohol dehydrogenase family)
MHELESTSALVTGAGNGIGRAIAGELARRGAAVAAVDIDKPGADATVEAIVAAGGRATAVPANLLEPGEIEEAVATAADAFGSLDILVNNAGVMDSLMTPTTVTLDQWERVMAVNATAPFLLIKYAVPRMIAQGGGAIVNIASIAGLAGARAGVAYTASKHAVVGLTRNVAWAYADQGIRCNAVCPGGVSTEIATRQVRGDERDPLGVERYRMATSMKPRPGEPREIANVVAFLASSDASFLNGAIVPVDGGWTAA